MFSDFTVKNRMESVRGFTSGFDYLRLFLALSVLAWHTIGITISPDFSNGLLHDPLIRAPIRLILPLFFALSGFLVSSSYDRTHSVKVFLGLRIIRILPALVVEICLSALILGPLLTTFSLRQYFTDPDFSKYLLNVFGIVHFNLPGVFLQNICEKMVNGSLWTVPFELECYVTLTALMITRLYSRRRFLIAAFAVITAVVFWLTKDDAPAIVFQSLPGRMLILNFLAGVILYRIRDFLPYDKKLFLLCLAVSFGLMDHKYLIFLSPLPLAYVTVFLGLANPKKLPVLFTGDYSYGIYLYAFPIQQMTAQLITTKWYLHLLVATTLTGLFAAFSWHFIEKPAQQLKRKLLKKPAEPIVQLEKRAA
jgi:peptidoglycan/LPS O-acetylase OafA/YrhL